MNITHERNIRDFRKMNINKKRYFGILVIGLCMISVLLYAVVWPCFPHISRKDMLCAFSLLWLFLSHIAVRCSAR